MKGKEQFTIHMRNRPMQWGFLINEELFKDNIAEGNRLLDLIVDYNNTHWGGRKNPIVIFNEKEIDLHDWEYLKTGNPDGITIFGSIGDELLDEVHRKLLPIDVDLVEKIDDDYRIIETSLRGIPTPPTEESISNFADSKLLMTEFAEDVDDTVYRTVHRNFGTFHQWRDRNQENKVRRIAWLERCMEPIDHFAFELSSIESLDNFLTRLAGRIRKGDMRGGVGFIPPSSLSMAGLGDGYVKDSSIYRLYIGSSPRDFTEYWNSFLLRGDTSIAYKYQMWLPEEVAFNENFSEGILDWLGNYTNYGASDRHTEILSRSLPDEKLALLRDSLLESKHVWGIRIVNRNEEAQRRKRKEHPATNRFGQSAEKISNSHDTVQKSMVSSSETFHISIPEVIKERVNPNGGWMVDLVISDPSGSRFVHEFKPWHLPPAHSGGLLDHMFKNPSRLNTSGQLSCYVERDKSWHYSRKPDITVSIPDKREIFWYFFSGPLPRFLEKTQEQPSHREISDLTISEKGKYLDGFISLFKDLSWVDKYLENRFWIEVLKSLSGHDPRKDSTLQNEISNAIQPHLKENTENSDIAKSLAHEITAKVRGRLKPKTMSLIELFQNLAPFSKIDDSERINFIQGSTNLNTFSNKYTHDDLREDLDRLLRFDVLRIGVESVCPSCKLAEWRSAQDIRQHDKCTGCGDSIALPHAPTWKYMLNSSIAKGVGEGVIGVAHAIACLEKGAFNFFSWIPSADLFKGESKQAYREIDFICVKDGALIIGEVKESFIQEKEIESLTESALLIRPNVVYVVMYHENSRGQIAEITSWINKANESLSKHEIIMQLYELPVFPQISKLS